LKIQDSFLKKLTGAQLVSLSFITSRLPTAIQRR
jgi:hypothetical protein